MYRQHFGLTKPLFDDGIAQDSAVFLDTAQRAAMSHVPIALASRDSAILLCGPPGTGKTTFAAAAIRTSSSSTRLASTWLSTAPLTPNELLELLLAEFGFDPYKHSRVERLQIWRQFLTELGATDTRIFIAVEQADQVEPAVLHALASLTVADPNGCPGANLVLMGQDGLIDLLNTPSLRELKQRVRLIRRFESLSDEGVESYLEHCVREAGGDCSKVFSADAIPALRAYSGGIFRVLNTLCDTALSLAAVGGEPSVTRALVTRAAVELCGMEPLAAEPDAPPARAALPDCAEPVVGGAQDEIPVLTESVEIDLGSGEYEAVTLPDSIDCTASGIDEKAVPLTWNPREILELTFARHDISSLPAAAPGDTEDAGDESLDEVVDFGAAEPESLLASTTDERLDDVNLDELTAELAEAILSSDPPEHFVYPDFPEVTESRYSESASVATEAESADHRKPEPADHPNPLRARA